MKQDEKGWYIEDVNKQKLYYHLTPAVLISNFVPLVVILDEEMASELKNFEYKMWNILIPINGSSRENKDLLQELISKVADEYECEEHIYLYGTHEVFLHGVLCDANAFYVRTSFLRFENTLLQLLNSRNSFPIIYFCDDEPGVQRDNFSNLNEKYGIKIYAHNCYQDDELDKLKKILDIFERVTL